MIGEEEGTGWARLVETSHAKTARHRIACKIRPPNAYEPFFNWASSAVSIWA
jgi:hypothetical protein